VAGAASGRPLLSVAMWRLRPFGFFPPSSPRVAGGTVSAALTARESMTAAVGRGERPARTRSRSRGWSCAAVLTPASVQRRNRPWIVPRGGDFAGGRARAIPPPST
jgi:hypothetical protein